MADEADGVNPMMSTAAGRILRGAATVFAVAAMFFWCGAPRAQAPLLEEVRTIGEGAQPIEEPLEILDAGEYELTLTDLAVPGALQSVKLAITRGTTIVAATQAPPKVVRFQATAGSHVVRIVGVPAASAGMGTLGVQVRRVGSSTQVKDFVATIQAPPPLVPDNRVVIDTNFIANSAGAHEVRLADLQLPQDLDALILSVTRIGGNLMATLAGPGAVTFTAEAGAEYKLAVIAETAPAGVNAGLFDVRIRALATDETLLAHTVPVGLVERLGSVTAAAGPHVLSFADFQFPAPLTVRGAVLLRAGVAAARATNTGEVPFTASAGSYVLFALGVPSQAAGTGSYGVEVKPAGGAPLFGSVKTVGGVAGATPAFTFAVDVASAGSYRVRLADFAFTAAFNTIRLAAVQNSVLLAELPAEGTLDLNNVQAGRLFLLVLAQPGTPTGSVPGGLFGVDVVPTAGGSAIFEVTQGAGNLFDARRVSITAPGIYRVTVSDVGFPATLADLAVVVTRGAEDFGSVFGSSPLDFTATPGNYFLNFIARADAAERAGTYGIVIRDKPPTPTATFAASPTQVTSGGTVDLTWSSQNATVCTATGALNNPGQRATSGTERSLALTSASTFTLKCDGAGGSVTREVAVNIAASQDDSGGGGGSIDLLLLALLSLVLAARVFRIRFVIPSGGSDVQPC